MSTRRPPEELADGRIALRRFRTADAASLHEAVVASAAQLRPWLPGLGETAPSLAEYRDLIDDWWEAWSDRRIFAFRICDVADPAPTLGSCGLHARIGPGRLELGYWVRVDRTREGIATAAARLATAAALEIASRLGGLWRLIALIGHALPARPLVPTRSLAR